MSIRFRWLGFLCFEILLPSGKVLVVDPYIDYSPTAPIGCQEVTGADYIAVTHGHYDHVTDIGTLAQKFDAKVICSHQVAGPMAKLFNLADRNFYKVTAGDVVVFDDLKVEVKRGKHVDLSLVMEELYERLTGREAAPDISATEIQEAVSPFLSELHSPALRKVMEDMQAVGLGAGEQLTFVFQTSENLRICVYSSGAYESLHQEVIEAHANVFLGQLGGVNPEEAAEIAALSGAELIIPTHHDGSGAETMRNTVAEMEKHLTARSPAHLLNIIPGQWYEIGLKVSQL